MEPMYGGSTDDGSVSMMEVITQPADKAVEFIAKLSKRLSEEYEFVNISSAMPIYLNRTLHYTFTITCGDLV